VLVRRQQREYPQELREEIALAALEVGNNREVARLYSERLGYTVNESTVRGIKKRYLEGVQKGKIHGSPALSPRVSGGEESRDGGDSEEEEEEHNLEPQNCMKLQLEVLEGRMRDSVAVGHCEGVEDEEELVDGITEVNGEDSLVINESALEMDEEEEQVDDEELGQLSIVIGEDNFVPKPTIRIRQGLTNGSAKRKAINGVSVHLPAKKTRPSVVESEAEMAQLEKEVAALQWLARKKEQEWDQVIRLLKQKEERLMRAQRNKTMSLVDTQHLLTRLQSPLLQGAVVVPSQQVLLLPAQPRAQPGRQPLNIAPKPASSTTPKLSNSNNTITPKVEQEAKYATVLDKAKQNLAKATKGKVEEEGKEKGTGTGAGGLGGKKPTPACQGCGKKKSEFVCAGCSNRWYCSRECQVEDWDEHADDCSG